MQDRFVSNLFFTLGFIGKIAVPIAVKVTGLLNIGIIWIIVCCIVGLFCPMGSTICFVILKLTGLLGLGWIWVLVPLVLDLFCLHCLLNIYAGKH